MTALEALGQVTNHTLAQTVGRTFDFMEIAEEEIKNAGGTRGNRSPAWRCFAALQPTEFLRGFGDELYRAHCRELLARAKAGRKNLDVPTDAEVLGAISIASLASPLTSSAAAAMSALFSRVFPGREFEPAGHEAYPGDAEQTIAEFRNQAAKLTYREREAEA